MLEHPQLDAALLAMMAVGQLGYFGIATTTKKTIGARGQFTGVCLMIPGVVLLALEGKLSECSTGMTVGAFAGYLFSGLAALTIKTRVGQQFDCCRMHRKSALRGYPSGAGALALLASGQHG
jgi:hypothetical protein